MKTKEKILKAALDVLLQEGFPALTQTRVAEVAGVKLVKDRPQVEELPLLRKGKLPLHGQLWTGDFAFGPSHRSETLD